MAKPVIKPYAPFFDPSARVFHYGQAILKE
jgi:hypothetical protein